MSRYRVVCAIRQTCPASSNHFHALNIGTGDPTVYSRIWSIAEVRAAMDAGETFYVLIDGLEVEPKLVRCGGCGMEDTLSPLTGLPNLH